MGLLRRRGFIYILILVAIVLLVFAFLPRGEGTPEGSIGQVAELVENGYVEVDGEPIAGTIGKIEHSDNTVTIFNTDDDKLLKTKYQVESSDGLRISLINNGVSADTDALNYITYNPPSGFDWGGLFISFLPVLLLIGLFWFLLRGAQGASNQAFNFSRSRA